MTKQSNYPAKVIYASDARIEQNIDEFEQIIGIYTSVAPTAGSFAVYSLLTTQQQLEDMVRELMHRLDTFVRFDALLPGMPNNKADLIRQSTEAIQQATNLLEKK